MRKLIKLLSLIKLNILWDSDMTSRIYSKIIGSGSYLPEKVVLNTDMEKIVDTSDEWISERTGIKRRHIAADNEYTSDMALKALQNALKSADLEANDLDGIIVATTTPDQIFPSTATILQGKLGANNSSFSMDVNGVCAGFVYALSIANSMILSGSAKRIAVIGAETMSRIVDWKDRATCVLFGDGAGAFILEVSNTPGILSSNIASDGGSKDILCVEGGPSRGNMDAKIVMNGREVFKQAIEKMASSSAKALKDAYLSIDDVDWLIPHQANQRILNAVATRVGAPMEKLISTISEHANTSAASIPLAFDKACRAGDIKDGNVVLLSAFGAGTTWGSIVLRK